MSNAKSVCWRTRVCVGEPWTCVGHSNVHNSAVIRSKLMIFFFPESSHRAAARGTVPDRFRLIPEEFLMKILTVLRKSGLFVKNNDFFKKVAPKIEVPAPRRARYVPAFQKIQDYKNTFFHEIGLHKPEFDETWAGLHQISKRFSWCYSRIKRIFKIQND